MAMPVTATDIVNRGLQRVGATIIAAGALLTENSKSAQQARACYDTLRRAEIQSNVWRFSIRLAALRAMDTNSKLVTFGAYASGTSYAINDVVLDTDGQLYFSRIASNTGNTPQSSPTKWTLYFGPIMASEYVTTWSATITYALGDSVIGSDGNKYISLVAANLNHDPTTDAVRWGPGTVAATATSFFAGELVFTGGKVYISLLNDNDDAPGASSWLLLTTAPTLALPHLIYPLGTGPSSQLTTRNIFWLPNGYLREAPQDPKLGGFLQLGSPQGGAMSDWLYQDQCFTSGLPGPIIFRFAADVQDTSLFHPLFVEGFGCRIAIELCEILTNSGAKIEQVEKLYNVFMGRARTVNGIETGPVFPPQEQFITVRY